MTIRDRSTDGWTLDGARELLERHKTSSTERAPASYEEIIRQTWADTTRVQNQDASATNRIEAYDEINDRIKTAIGVSDLLNPAREGAVPRLPGHPVMPGVPYPAQIDGVGTTPIEQWKARIGELRQQHPDALDWDDVLDRPERQALAKMKEVREATERLDQRMGTIRGDDIPYLRNVPLVREVAAVGANLARAPVSTMAQFGAGFAGAMTSPIDAAANVLGFASGTRAMSLLRTASYNALANAAVQAPLSAAKMGDYQAAGLPYGWNVWLSEVEGAASAGFVLDAAFRAPMRAVRAYRGETGLGGVLLDAVPEVKLPPKPEGMAPISPETIAASERGDLAATRQILEATGAIDDPEVRGALNHVETVGRLDSAALERLKEMGVPRAEGVRILDGLVNGRYVRPADVAADVDRMTSPLPPRIPDVDASRVVDTARASLDALAPGMADMVAMAVEARAQSIEAPVRRAMEALNGAKPDPARIAETLAREVREVLSDEGEATRIGRMIRVASGSASSPEIARMLQDDPTLKSALNIDLARHAEALALSTMSEADLSRVLTGDVPPQVGAWIANHIPVAKHGEALDVIAKARPADIAEAVRLLDETVDQSNVARETSLARPDGMSEPTGPELQRRVELMREDAGEAVKAAQEPIKERDKLDSKVEGLKGEIAKLEEKAGGDQMFALADRELTDADATALAKKRAELHEAETQLADANRRLNPDPVSARELHAYAMRSIAIRREQDVRRAIAHAVMLGRAIAPEGTRIDVRTEEMRSDTGELVEAYYAKGDGAIVLASYAADPTARMGHEVVHALVDVDALTPAEVKLLADEAVSSGAFTPEMRARYEKAYINRVGLTPDQRALLAGDKPDVAAVIQSLSSEQRFKFDALIQEEAAAHLIDARLSGKAKGAENTIAGRLAQLIERLRNLLQGYGFRSREDVVAAVLNGEAARRAQQAEPVQRFMAENDISAMAVRPVGRRPDLMFSLADRDTGQSMRRDLDALGYYSQAIEAARSLKQAKGTPEQMLAQLKSAGVKDAEIEATGLHGFLDGKRSITRDEIVTHLEANRVGLREVMRDRSPPNARELANLRRNTGSEDDQLAAALGLGDDPSLPLDRTKWSKYSLDPSNPTYRETVLHLPEAVPTFDEYLAARIKKGTAWEDPSPDNLATYRADYERGDWRNERSRDYVAVRAAQDTNFRSGHFPEPNVVGHMMTSMTRHEGRPVYTIDQIQSDWGQKLRDGGVRDEAKIAELKRRSQEADARLLDIQNELPEVGYDLSASVAPGETRQIVRDYFAAQEQARLIDAELRTAEAATFGNPLVNTTDQWVNTTLRRALRQAAEAGAEFIAVPHGDTVLSYNPEGPEGPTGMRKFYGTSTDNGIVPKNLRNLIRKLDKDAPSPVRVKTLETPTKGLTNRGDRKISDGGSDFGFTLFPLTDKVKAEVMERGQAMFALADAPQAETDQIAPRPILETEYGAIDRMNQMKNLIEACAA